jgi:hypothetical protein
MSERSDWSAHRFVDAAAGQPAGCSCGWLAERSVSPELSQKRWQLHVDTAVAVQRREEAVELLRRLQHRAIELRGLRSFVVGRRNVVVRQRATLARQLSKVRKDGPSAVGPPALRYLDRARSMADLSISALWIRYVAVGGSLELEQIRAALLGTRRISAHEFNHLAVAVNEAFADLDMGHPIDYVTTGAVESSGQSLR